MLDGFDGLEDDAFGVPVHTIDKGNNQELRISLNEYKGHKYIDIRVFYSSPEGLRPTKKGVTLNPNLYPELLQGIVLLGEALGFDADAEG